MKISIPISRKMYNHLLADYHSLTYLTTCTATSYTLSVCLVLFSVSLPYRDS